jgi:Glycosyl transferase family 2
MSDTALASPRRGAGAPRLTVCIATHHGRAATLAELLDDLLRERDQRFDVVICDNASTDETAAVVERARAAGLDIDYRRHAVDVGAARNIAATVEHARGEHCWLLGSDDRLMPGAVARVLELLTAHPDAAGLTVHQAAMDFTMTWVAAEQASRTIPELPPVALLRGTQITAALGWIASGLSSQVVRREAWLNAIGPVAADERFPHVRVILGLAAQGVSWIWCADKLVLVRGANTTLPVAPERWEALLLGELDALWRAGSGADRRALRAVRARYVAVAEGRLRRWRPAEAAPRRADDIALLAAMVRALAGHPRFWRAVAPGLAVRVVTPRSARGRRLRAAAQWRLRRADGGASAARIDGPIALPAITTQADALTVRVALEARGRGPVEVGARWRRPDADAWHDDSERLLLPWPRSRRRRCDVPLTVPLDPGPWELAIGAAPQGAWPPEPADGARAMVEVRGSGHSLAACATQASNTS